MKQKYYTTSIYVETLTGEIIKTKDLKEYTITNKIIKYETRNSITIKHITNECRHNGKQLELQWEDPGDRKSE